MAYRPEDPAHRRLAYAAYLCALAHDGQFRKGERVPYSVHPLRVGEILAHLGCDDDVVIAGMLHDVLEDGRLDEQGKPVVGRDEILAEFGPQVLELVEGASEPDKDASWEERKEHTIHYLAQAPIAVLLVACADKLDNVSAAVEDLKRLGEGFWSRFNRPREQQQWYHTALLEAFLARGEEDERLRRLALRYAAAVADLYSL